MKTSLECCVNIWQRTCSTCAFRMEAPCVCEFFPNFAICGDVHVPYDLPAIAYMGSTNPFCSSTQFFNQLYRPTITILYTMLLLLCLLWLKKIFKAFILNVQILRCVIVSSFPLFLVLAAEGNLLVIVSKLVLPQTHRQMKVHWQTLQIRDREARPRVSNGLYMFCVITWQKYCA